MTQGRHDFLLHQTAASELDPISEIPSAGVSLHTLCLEPRAFALELANIADGPRALQAPLTSSIAGLLSHLRNPLGGVSPRALSRALSVCLRARKNHGEALSSTSSPHQEPRRSCFARAPSRSHFGDSFLRKLRRALVSRLESSKSWLRQASFKVHRKIARKLLMSHLIVVLEVTLNVHRCLLARATGPFSSHDSFWLVQKSHGA